MDVAHQPTLYGTLQSVAESYLPFLSKRMAGSSLLKLKVSPRLRWVALWGPGLLVMLADCDAGNVVTAAQAGAQWGVQLLVVLLALIPLLYMVQELTVRLGIFTGRGHGELIRAHFGPLWAWISAIGLVIAVLGSLVTEFTGVAGVGEMFGHDRPGDQHAEGTAQQRPGTELGQHEKNQQQGAEACPLHRQRFRQ